MTAETRRITCTCGTTFRAGPDGCCPVCGATQPVRNAFAAGAAPQADAQPPSDESPPDDLLAQAIAKDLSTPDRGRRAGHTCPGCRKPMPVGAVFCTECGYDVRRNQKHVTFQQVDGAMGMSPVREPGDGTQAGPAPTRPAKGSGWAGRNRVLIKLIIWGVVLALGLVGGIVGIRSLLWESTAVGTWKSSYQGENWTLLCRDDNTFEIICRADGAGEVGTASGRWKVDQMHLVLDVRSTTGAITRGKYGLEIDDRDENVFVDKRTGMTWRRVSKRVALDDDPPRRTAGRDDDPAPRPKPKPDPDDSPAMSAKDKQLMDKLAGTWRASQPWGELVCRYDAGGRFKVEARRKLPGSGWKIESFSGTWTVRDGKVRLSVEQSNAGHVEAGQSLTQSVRSVRDDSFEHSGSEFYGRKVTFRRE